MIWAIVSSWSCFCWPYKASPSLAAKNIITLISVLTSWWCPYVESCVVGRGCLLWPVRSLGRTFIRLCPASFCTPRPNLPVTSGVSWLRTFAFQSPIWRGHLFGVSFKTSFGVSLLGLYRTIQLHLLQHYWLGHRLELLWYWMVCPGNEQRSFCRFWDCIQVWHFEFFCWLWWLLHFL